MQPALARPVSRPRSVRLAAQLGRLLLGLLVLLLVLVIGAEVAFRLFGPFVPGNYETLNAIVADPIYGRFHNRDVSGWTRLGDSQAFIRFNSEGLRGSAIPFARPPDTYRILVLGDAFVEGPATNEDDTWAGRLETALSQRNSVRRYQVVNAGISGWGTAEQAVWLREQGLRYQPDLVIAQFYLGNDVSDNGCRLLGQDKLRHKVCFLPDSDGRLRQLELRPREVDQWEPARIAVRRHSALFNVYETGVLDYLTSKKGDLELSSVWKTNMRIFEVDQKNRKEWDEAWQVSELLLARLRDDSAAGRARFMIVTVPSVYQVNDAVWRTTLERNDLSPRGWDMERPNARLREMVARLQVSAVDLLPAFRAEPDSDELYLRADRHFSTRGHALVAREVERALAEQRLLD